MIAQNRLSNQLLSQHTFQNPCEVVSWMGAIQAQEYPAAKWALGVRMDSANEGLIDQALDEGSILRTHIMRPTWHYVAPADIRWMLKLTSPRVHAASAYWYRQLQLDGTIFKGADEIIAKALEGGKHLTREELASPLVEAGIDVSDLRLTFLLFHAELEGIICNGKRKGKQITYALLDERVPLSTLLTPDEALAELTKRYFTSHGPATLKDFVWWSGLTVAEAKKGVESVKNKLVQEAIDGQTYWSAEPLQTPRADNVMVHLLPAYDEYTVGYTDRSAIYDSKQDNQLDTRGNILFNYLVVINGIVVGTWKRTTKKAKVEVSLNLFRQLTDEEETLLQIQLERYARFFNMSVEVNR